MDLIRRFPRLFPCRRQSAQPRDHRFAQLARKNECRFILNAQIPGQGEHALALHLVAERLRRCRHEENAGT